MKIIVRYPYIIVSQGSVATKIICGDTLNNHVIANFPQNVQVKTCENRSIFVSFSEWQSGTFWRHGAWNCGINDANKTVH